MKSMNFVPSSSSLRHDRVVVVGLGQMAVVAVLGFGLALGVRVVRRECLRRIAGGRDRRLLDVDVFAIDVGRRQHQRRGRTHRRDLVILDLAVHAEEEHVVARDLRVVGGEVAGEAAFVFVPLGLPVRLDRQMAAAATRRPRGVAGVAQHLVFVVRALFLRHVGAPALRVGIHRHRVRTRGLGVVARRHRVGSVLDQAIVHSSPGVTAERWISLPSTHSKRFLPSGLRISSRSLPYGEAAGPEVFSVGNLSTVPWQSWHWISTAPMTSALM